jgi:hypothetical protein
VGMLLLRSLGVLVSFQLLALAVVVAAVRGSGGRVALAALALVGGIALAMRSLDPAAQLASGVAGGWIVVRSLRHGFGFGRTSLAALVPVIAAAVLNLVGMTPRQSWSELQSQVEVLAGVEEKSPPATPNIAPEERVVRERRQELARSAAHWALRLVPAEIVVFGWLQVLVVVAGARRLVARTGAFIAMERPSRWTVPFGWVWVLAAGLALAALRVAWTVTLGFNLVAVVTAVFAVQGSAVTLAAIERGASRVAPLLLLVLAAVVAWPLFVGSLALLGAADLWVDFRRLHAAGTDS